MPDVLIKKCSHMGFEEFILSKQKLDGFLTLYIFTECTQENRSITGEACS